MKPTIDAFLKDPNGKPGEVLESLLSNVDWGAYLKRWPDVAAQFNNGLTHYLFYGHKEPRLTVDIRVPGSPQPQPPSPGGWQPPTTPGLHEICRLDGPFGMSVCRVADGLLIGTYRPAKLYHFDGGKPQEKLSLPVESIYMLQMFADGLPGFTTECPAQAYKCLGDWDQWERVMHRDEPESVAFEYQPLGSEWVIQTVDRAWGNNTRLFKGNANGKAWAPWIDIPNKRLLNFGSDGNTIKCCGSTGSSATDLPLITNERGGNPIVRPEMKDQQYNYIIGSGGVWNMGAVSITKADGVRNGYIDLYEGNVVRTVKDLTRPWIMDMQIDPSTGHRWAICAAWDETTFPDSELARSTDGGRTWNVVAMIPMPSSLALHIADCGVYIVGGQKDRYMKVCFFKF